MLEDRKQILEVRKQILEVRKQILEVRKQIQIISYYSEKNFEIGRRLLFSLK